MSRAALIAGAVFGLAAAAVWAAGGATAAEAWTRAAARAAQAALAGAIRAMRAGEPGAMAGLLAIAFAYGLAHAAGPGHGKMLIGAYAAARRVRLAPMAGLALAASLAQATVAVVLVLAGAALFDLTRAELGRIADVALPPFGHAAIAALGLWLVWRGVRGLRRASAGPGRHDHGHDHDHGHGHDHDHGDHACGHAHAPTPEQVAAVAGWRDAALLVGAVALRPCSGAVFLLVVCWQFGMLAAGIAGAYAMGLGTATVAVGAAALAVWAREGAFAALPGAARVRTALPAVEAVAGLAIAATGLWLLSGGA